MNPVIIQIIIFIAISIIAGVIYFFSRKKALAKISERKKELEILDKDIITRQNLLTELTDKLSIEENKNCRLEVIISDLKNNLSSINNEITMKQSELKNLEEIYQKQLTDKKETIKQELTDSKNKQIEKMQQELKDYSDNIKSQKEKIEKEYQAEVSNFNNILQDYKSKRESIIKISKEEEEMRENAKFYTLHISPNDIADIEILERVKPSLSRPDILSKLIYKTYYEKPYTDLVGRVIGNEKVTGIYKITNLTNNKVYIGQAVDIAERWRQHIKRAVGAEPMTTNKLYPIMQETGPYNFSWQIVEECKKEELTAKEKYWIQYYDGQGYGYNIKG